MDVETLDLLQFHWWDYCDARYLDALGHLAELRDAGADPAPRADQLRYRAPGAASFDRGIRIVSNQVQYSLIDRRPEVAMADLCASTASSCSTYGTVCGGLLSDATWGSPSRACRAHDRQPAEVQADDRRLGRLGAVPGLLNVLKASLTAARQHRQRRRRATSSTVPPSRASSSARGSGCSRPPGGQRAGVRLCTNAGRHQ